MPSLAEIVLWVSGDGMMHDASEYLKDQQKPAIESKRLLIFGNMTEQENDQGYCNLVIFNLLQFS